MTKGCLVKGYFQNGDEGCEALARTQVYLSKTKLQKYRWSCSCIYRKSTIRVNES